MILSKYVHPSEISIPKYNFTITTIKKSHCSPTDYSSKTSFLPFQKMAAVALRNIFMLHPRWLKIREVRYLGIFMYIIGFFNFGKSAISKVGQIDYIIAKKLADCIFSF